MGLTFDMVRIALSVAKLERGQNSKYCKCPKSLCMQTFSLAIGAILCSNGSSKALDEPNGILLHLLSGVALMATQGLLTWHAVELAKHTVLSLSSYTTSHTSLPYSVGRTPCEMF